MKKIIITLVTLLIFNSCTQMILPADYEQLHFNGADEILQYIEDNFTYCYDWNSSEPSIDHHQSPQETLLLKTGDCDDFTIFFMYYYYLTTGIKCKIYYMRVGIYYHYMPIYEDIAFETTDNKIMSFDRMEEILSIKVINIYNYDEIFLDI